MSETFSDYNVIAAFPDMDSARDAVAVLHDDGLDATKMSFLSRSENENVAPIESKRDAEDTPHELTKGAAVGGVAGTAAGGAAGFLGGLAAFAIPGVGPALGTGVWAATVSGAVAGGTAGGVYGGIHKAWQSRLQDTIRQGPAVVGIHSDDRREVDVAAEKLVRAGAVHIDMVDQEAKPLD